MTNKLYDHDSHLKQTVAVVRASTQVEGGWDVLLDQTILFPEGGGQPCDIGMIGEASVLHCRSEEGEVVHRVDRPLAVGAQYTVTLDWARRFDLMQQHTGEHLLSFSFYKLFSANNVGFHLALQYATIDFDKPLSREQIAEAEAHANAFVWRDLPVSVAFYQSEASLGDLPLRKHAEGLSAPIRVVSIEDADQCTCCAPHCARTGEIGLILVSDAVAYKGGTRITFSCGQRALRQTRAAHDDADAIARRFSTSRERIVSAVSKLADEYGLLKKRERDLTRALNAYVSAELLQDAAQAGKYRVVARLLVDADAERLKDLALRTADSATLCLVCAVTNGRLFYTLACGEGFPLALCELIEAVNAAFGGKGGGRGTLAQGTAPAASGMQETVSQLCAYFCRRLAATK